MSGIIGSNTGRASGLIKAAGGGDYVKLATGAVSNTARTLIDGYFTATYDTYMYVLQGLGGQGGAVDFEISLNRSGSEVTSAEYDVQMYRAWNGSSVGAAAPSGKAAPYRHLYLGNDADGTQIKQANNMILWVFDPLLVGTTDRYSSWIWQGTSAGGTSVGQYAWGGAGALQDNVGSAISGIAIGGDANTCNCNKWTVYGLK